MDRDEKEKSEEPWVGRSILGVAAAGAVAVAAGAFFALSRIGDSADQDQAVDDLAAARPTRTMKGPDTGGQRISRDRFEADPKSYFVISRQKGTKAAVDAFK